MPRLLSTLTETAPTTSVESSFHSPYSSAYRNISNSSLRNPPNAVVVRPVRLQMHAVRVKHEFQLSPLFPHQHFVHNDYSRSPVILLLSGVPRPNFHFLDVLRFIPCDAMLALSEPSNNVSQHGLDKISSRMYRLEHALGTLRLRVNWPHDMCTVERGTSRD